MQVDRSAVEELVIALFEAHGAPAGHARTVTAHLLEAGAMGLPSHGLIRVPQYLGEIEAGELDPAAVATIEQGGPARLHIDGGRGFGQVVGMAMVEAVAPVAHAEGVAVATGRRMGHTGRIGAYPEALARHGLLGIVVCSGPRSGHWVAPFGGREGRMATNPIAFACPVEGGEPIVADFSTAMTAEGVIRSLRNRGLLAPQGFLRDAEGRATNDPNALYATPRGAIQPLGGALGYRGTGLGLLVELLASTLAGDEIDDPLRVGSNLAMIAIAPDSGFGARAARLAAYVRSSPPIDPGQPVLLPGDRERAQAARAGSAFVDDPTWSALTRAATAAGLTMPAPLEG